MLSARIDVCDVTHRVDREMPDILEPYMTRSEWETFCNDLEEAMQPWLSLAWRSARYVVRLEKNNCSLANLSVSTQLIHSAFFSFFHTTIAANSRINVSAVCHYISHFQIHQVFQPNYRYDRHRHLSYTHAKCRWICVLVVDCHTVYRRKRQVSNTPCLGRGNVSMQHQQQKQKQTTTGTTVLAIYRRGETEKTTEIHQIHSSIHDCFRSTTIR
jgi:hypothetical protein